MTLKELAKYAPKVHEIVNAASKSKAVASFKVIIPAQKLPGKKKKSAESKPAKPSSKKSNPKTGKKKTSPKKRKK